MKKITIKNKYLNNIGKALILVSLSLLVINIFEFFNILPEAITAGLKVLVIIIAIFSSAYRMINSQVSKGWLVGIKLAIAYMIILLLINFLLLNQGFSLKLLLYFTLITLSSVLGAMIGVFKKQEPVV